MILLRYNLPAIQVNEKDVDEIEYKNNLVYIYMKNGKYYIGYTLKNN